MFAFYLIALISAAVITARPDGAPLDSCDTMTPIHSTDVPQTSTSPFELILSSNSVESGSYIIVTLQGTDLFQGFLLKGLAEGQTTGVAGTFTLNMTDRNANLPCKYLACGGVPQGALTHVDPADKAIIMTAWTSTVAGTFNIVASIAQTYDLFWVMVTSENIVVT